MNGLLEKLNGTLVTSYTLETLSESLRSALESCVEQHYDFGTAYARLRPYWVEDASRDIAKDERKDQDIRKRLLADNKIIDGDAPPRRVWDLYANRVVPYWVVGKYPWAISHAWVNDDELTHVMTPINQNEWPVPIPKDANLDLIRIEILNLGAEYVWLDVLCMKQKVSKVEARKLRRKLEQLLDMREETMVSDWQEGPLAMARIHGDNKATQQLSMIRNFKKRFFRSDENRRLEESEEAPSRFEWIRKRHFEEKCRVAEMLRRIEMLPRQVKEEWMIDVPTIGWVYRQADQVVGYFAGLGRPLNKIDFESDRSWFNRAWTLQEMNIAPITAGITGLEEQVVLDKFHTRLESVRQMRRDDFVFDILSKMRTRKSTNPVDKVASLIYLFHSECIPIYDGYQSEEDAWTALLNVTQDWFRADLFFFYPQPGDGKSVWRPSWRQAMNHTVSWRDPSQVMGKIQFELGFLDSYCGPYIESGAVRGLGDATDASAQTKSRRGELFLEDRHGKTHTFKIIADHAYPISDGTYTLIGSTGFPSTQSALLWVVGKTESSNEEFKYFRKSSVLSMADDRVGARLQGLKIAEDREVFLR